MKMNLRLLSAITLITLTTFTACKKETSTPATDNSSEIATQSDDQANVSSEVDDVTTESSGAMESNATFTGRFATTTNEICDGSIVADTASDPRKITITYNGGTRCNGKQSTRTGVVVITMAKNMHWRDAGAVINVSYQNLKITKTGTNKSITLNGTHTITNVSGGLLASLYTGQQSVIHTINSSNMSITFEDGTKRTWQVARKRVYTLSNQMGVATITGTKTEGNVTGIAEWGMNREGHAFTTAIKEPLVIRQDCSYRLTSGQISHTGIANVSITFGLNADGIATTCPAAGSTYYFKAVWTGPNGNSLSVIRPY